MGDYYLGEIRAFPYGIIPRGWHLCDGALLNTSQNQALFALIGYNYGGSGTQFALPDLRGRTMIGFSRIDPDFSLAKSMGSETVTLALQNLPTHTHYMEVANANGNAGISTNRLAIPKSKAPAEITANIYTTDKSSLTYLNASTLDTSGGNQPHENMQPFLVMNYCIAVSNATWPSRDD